MSTEPERSSKRQLFTFIKVLLRWKRKARTAHAHPWSAYAPATYLAGSAPPGIVIATAAGSLLEETIKLSHTITTTEIDRPSRPANPDLEPALVENLAGTQPAVAHLTLVKSSPTREPEPVLPALAAWTGQEFLFAARLSGVNKLNRPMPSFAVSRSSLNRHQVGPATSKPIRSLAIKPPAVLRNRRRTAQIIPFQRAGTRGQIRSRAAA